MADVVEAISLDGVMPCYRVSDAELGPGASLGNGHCWVNTGTDGRVRSFFSTDVGEEVAGPLIVRYASADTRVEAAGRGGKPQRADVPLMQAEIGQFVLHPAYQSHSFELPGSLAVEETVFVPHGPPDGPLDETVLYYLVRVQNQAGSERRLSAYAFCRFAGSRRTPTIRGDWDPHKGVLYAWEEGQADWVRALTASPMPVCHALTGDFGALYDADVVPPLDGNSGAAGDVVGCLEVHLHLDAGAEGRMAFILAFTPQGRQSAERQVARVREAEPALAGTVDYVREKLSLCGVMTPDPVINEGAYWSKVNMLRVMAHYPQGQSFTNEPGVSSNVVARDAAWFIYGCDHFMPDASRDLLNELVESQYDSGMIPEYFDARTGRSEDYGLNINDATPLFVLAVNHHCRSTGDVGYLGQVYGSVRRASEYILSQRDERGLVFCSAEGVEVHGICGWRNVIPNYRINGAVTEVNAECAAALRAMGHMAENIGRADDYNRFYGAAEELTEAINEHLLDSDRRLYLLNIDTKGRRHTDVTADELFPVLFRVAEEDVAFRIIRRLNSPDFWTPAGLRCCSQRDPLYDPARYVGLLGGVWPGVTWWYAFAAARYHPEFMVRALHASYEHYNEHPRIYSTVPGQFSEWFDGESLINRGMRLSPWEPPRFLWAAVEGVCGFMMSPARPGIRPLIPPEWKWCAAVKVCYHGGHITAFTGRMPDGLHVYADADFREAGAKTVLEEDLTERVRVGHAGIHPVALAGEGRVLVALGSCRDSAIMTPVELRAVLEGPARYSLREFSSERSEWLGPESGTGEEFASMAVRVEAGGFHLMRFEQQ